MSPLSALLAVPDFVPAEANTGGTAALLFAIVIALLIGAGRLRVPTLPAAIGIVLTLATLLALGLWRDAAGRGGLGTIGRVRTGRGFDGHGSAPISAETIAFALFVALGGVSAFGLGILHTRRSRPARKQLWPWILLCTLLIGGATWFLRFDALTRLHAAATRGDSSTVGRLLRANRALANAPHFHRTPLWNAARGGSAEVIEHLVTAGADLAARTSIPTRFGSPDPVLRALQAGHVDAASTLLRAESAAGIEPIPWRLAWVAREGHAAGIAPLLESGIPVDWPHDWGDSEVPALSLADNTEVVRALLDHGADPHLGHPLHNAVHKSIEAVQLLLDAGADIDDVDWQGRTPLGIARPEAAKRLLAHAASIELAHPLHWAVRCNNPGTVKLLLEAGADPNALDAEGKRAIDYANVEVIREMLR